MPATTHPVLDGLDAGFEITDELYLNALIEIGLVLFIITLIVNSLSRLLIWSMARSGVRSRAVPAAPLETAA